MCIKPFRVIAAEGAAGGNGAAGEIFERCVLLVLVDYMWAKIKMEMVPSTTDCSILYTVVQYTAISVY